MNKSLIAKSAIAAAIAAPDKDVPVPTRHVAGSFTSQVAGLSPGEFVSKAQKLGPEMTMAKFSNEGAAMKEQLRNSITPSVAQAKAKTEGVYQIEVGTMITTGNTLYLVAIVTRVD